MNTADSLFNIGEVQKAINICINAEPYFRKNNDWENWHDVISCQRRYLLKNKNYNLCEKLLVKHEKFIPNNEKKIRAIFKYRLGYNYVQTVQYEKANQQYKESIELFQSLDDKTPKKYIFIYAMFKSISLNYSRLGDQRSALTYCNKAIKIAAENEMENKFCELFINKGKFHYYTQEYEEAYLEYNKAMDVCFDNSDVSFLYFSKADILLSQKQYSEAKLLIDSGFNFSPIVDEYFLERNSRYLFGIGDFEGGKKATINIINQLKSKKDSRRIIKQLVTLSISLYEHNEKTEALSYAHQALCLFYSDLDTANVFDRPSELEKLPYTYIIEAFNIKAKYFKDQYLETGDEDLLKEAVFYYDLLLSHFDKLKNTYYSSSAQHRMGAYSQYIYSEIITFYIDQYKSSNNQKYLEKAFSLAQRANSFVLRNAISDRKALELAGVKQDSIENYLSLASRAATETEIDSTSAVEVLTEFDNYRASLFSNYPSYGKYEKEEEITITELQSRLGPNTLVIKYYFFDEILSFIGISKGLVFAENIQFPSSMDSLINVNLRILSNSMINDTLEYNYLKNSKIIYEAALGKILNKYDLNSIDHLVIVPDGPLKKVSFAALTIQESNEWDNPNSYLISKYAINYLYYCSQIKGNFNHEKSKDGFISFGIEYEDQFLKEIVDEYMSNFKDNHDDTRDISLSNLQYADDEAINSAEILQGVSFVNSDVTPSHVVSTINNYDVIHFSAHAFVDKDEYLNSFVVLNKDQDQNYQLKYSDILNLDINSELVVLSACQTSSGESVVGEGLMSLSRAFVQSGSNATVGAYWNAPDYTTKELMSLFYSNLKDGMPKSKAMQQAQIKYLTDDKISSPTIRSPFFWASWAVYGNDKSLEVRSSFFDYTSLQISLFLGVIVLLAFGIARYKFNG